MIRLEGTVCFDFFRSHTMREENFNFYLHVNVRMKGSGNYGRVTVGNLRDEERSFHIVYCLSRST